MESCEQISRFAKGYYMGEYIRIEEQRSCRIQQSFRNFLLDDSKNVNYHPKNYCISVQDNRSNGERVRGEQITKMEFGEFS